MRMKRKILIFIGCIVLVTGTGMSVLNQSRFGQLPRGERLERIKASPNYRNGEFQNINETPVISGDKSRFKVMMDFLFTRKVRVTPESMLPVVKTDLKSFSKEDDVLVWFGHSSYFMQIEGKTYLVDPVLSSYASPFSFINKAFKGTNIYSHNDFPTIDYLIITHDHWDHLDYQTVMDLKPKINHVVCGLGVGQHFEYWGFDVASLTELDWYEATDLGQGNIMTATPARHFSGRGLRGNKTLWTSFVLQTPQYNIFIGGDGGYDEHFKLIGTQYGPFDLAILEQGQYDKNWNLIHLMPDLVYKTAEDLKAKSILPVHNSRFALASHQWDEPLNKISSNHTDSVISVKTPKIGELVFLNDSIKQYEKWWKDERRE